MFFVEDHRVGFRYAPDPQHPEVIKEVVLAEVDLANNELRVASFDGLSVNRTTFGANPNGNGGVSCRGVGGDQRTTVFNPQFATNENGDVPAHDNSTANGLGSPITLAAV